MAVKRFSIQQIFTATMKNTANTEVLATLDDLKTCGISNEETVVYSMGGVGNPYINGFSHSKRATGNMSAATFKNEVMALITGTNASIGAVTVPVNNEVRTVNTNATTSVQTAVGTADAEFVGVYPYNEDGTRGDKLAQVATVTATGEYSYDSGTKTLTFFAGDFNDGEEVTLFYNATTDAEANTVTNETTTFAKTVRIELDTLVQDACSGEEYAAKLIIFKAKIQGSFAFDLAADGDPAELSVDFEALKASCSNSKLWDLVIIEDFA